MGRIDAFDFEAYLRAAYGTAKAVGPGIGANKITVRAVGFLSICSIVEGIIYKKEISVSTPYC